MEFRFPRPGRNRIGALSRDRSGSPCGWRISLAIPAAAVENARLYECAQICGSDLRSVPQTTDLGVPTYPFAARSLILVLARPRWRYLVAAITTSKKKMTAIMMP
jgi:hypothetical protein